MELIPLRVPIGPSPLLEAMRVIRNLGREGFVNHHEEITAGEQLDWWAEFGPSSYAWVYLLHGSNEFAGFGLVKPNAEGQMATTVAVTPAQRGHDYGRKITAHLVRAVPQVIYGSALKSNPAAVRLHSPDDWIEIDGPDESVRYFMTSPDIRARKAEDRDARLHEMPQV